MKVPFLVTLAGMATLSLSALATDLPYGSDALPYLARRSSVVIVAANSESVTLPIKDDVADPRTLTVALYAVEVKDSLKGDAQVGAKIVVAIPEAVKLPSVETLNDSFLFLDGPLQGEQRTAIGIERDGAIYLVISGRYGVVSANEQLRTAAVRDYLALEELDEPATIERKLLWAEQHLDKSDTFLQRSAILESARHPTHDKAVQLLTRAVRSNAISPQNKREAINGLEMTMSANAVQPLKEIAENSELPKSLRVAAIRAAGAVPGGTDELRKWNDSSDPVLKSSAAETIEHIERGRDDN